MGKPRVLLADDHLILLEGLRSLLGVEFEIVGAVQDGRALLEAAERLRPDLIILDLSMPVLGGLEAARRLRVSNPEAKLLALTMHSDVTFARQAFDAGVSGYVLKQSAARELTAAIHQVLNGARYIAEPLREAFSKRPRGPRAGRQGVEHELSPRQREVLQLMAEGHSAKDIAFRLGISVKTAEYHRYQIMEKLGIHTTAELTRYAIRHRMISAD